MEQPLRVFLCHQKNRDTADQVCAGWAGVHDGVHLLALRIALLEGRMEPDAVEATIRYHSPVLLFASGREAAEHGMAEIHAPGRQAVVAITKISRVRTDLITTEDT